MAAPGTQYGNERRKGSFITDALLKTIGGALIAAAVGIGGFALVEAYSTRLEVERLREKHEALDRRVNGIEKRSEKSSEKLEVRMKDLSDKFEKGMLELNRKIDQLNSNLIRNQKP